MAKERKNAKATKNQGAIVGDEASRAKDVLGRVYEYFLRAAGGDCRLVG